MTLYGHKAINRGYNFSISEAQTGWSVHNEDIAVTIDDAFTFFKRKARNNKLTTKKAARVIKLKIQEIKEKGIKTPLN